MASSPTAASSISAAGNLDRTAGLANAAGDHAPDTVTLEPVIPNPDKIICVGLNYYNHVQETGRTVTERNPPLTRWNR